MFSKLKNSFIGTPTGSSPRRQSIREGSKYSYRYSRPHFLNLNDDEIQASMDHRLRPIINPSERLVNNTGYAECINGGKSQYNEDQAVCQQGVLSSGSINIPYLYYALFDGHAGVGAAICAANQLHHVIHQRLVDAQDDIWQEYAKDSNSENRHNLIIGALEISFNIMDDIIKEELVRRHNNGGCTALVAISLLGCLYVANAGDSRAVVCSGKKVYAMSNDFTPETEKVRIRQLAQLKPHLLGNDFTYYEYIRPFSYNDLGKRILYRDAFMKGWTYKTVTTDDLKPSVITGQGKRSRVMATIGVTRGFGDHDLLSVHQRIPIKPFLSCHPEVQIYDLKKVRKHDVLVMGTDGLWDVTDGQAIAAILNEAVHIFDDRELYVSAATCLIGAARGSSKEQQWTLKNGRQASVDDISVFVIPLYKIGQDHKKMIKSISSKQPTLLLPNHDVDGDDGAGPSNAPNDPIDVATDETKSFEYRKKYLLSVIESVIDKQSRLAEGNNSEMCFVSAERPPSTNDNDNDVNVTITGQLPKEDFLLVKVNAIDTIDIIDESPTDLSDDVQRLLKLGEDYHNEFIEKFEIGKNKTIDLLLYGNKSDKKCVKRIRSRSFPGAATSMAPVEDLPPRSHCKNRPKSARYKLKLVHSPRTRTQGDEGSQLGYKSRPTI